MKQLLSFLLVLINGFCFAQKENWNWIIGDSSGIKFVNGQTPTPYTASGLLSECGTALSDTGGNLLIYCTTEQYMNDSLAVFNRNKNIMPNGHGIFGQSTFTQGSLLLKYPSDVDKVLLITQNIEFVQPYVYQRLFCSTISLSADSGRGDVIIKNDTLPHNYDYLTEKMIAIRHANGRDWWLLLHGSGFPTNKNYIKYLITPYGINGPFTQNIPNSNYHFAGDIIGQMAVTQQGDKIAFAGEGGTLDVLDFNRCSGQLTMRNVLGYTTQSMQYGYYGCCFSPDGNKLYVSEGKAYGYDSIFQFDLISLNKTLLWITPDSVVLGQMLLGPDNKLYISGNYGKNNSPTLDSANQYLSVINSPDSSGLACNFVPYQVWLGGRRSFGGLPNIPNYSLGRLDGSVCDSLGNVGIGNLQREEVDFKIYPNPTQEKLVISLNGFYTTVLQVTIASITGTPVCRNYLPARHKFCEIDVSELPAGVYFISLQTNKGKLYRKFIKE